MMETKLYCDICGTDINFDDDEYYGITIKHNRPEKPYDYDYIMDIDLCGICYFKTIEKKTIETIEAVEK